MGPNILIVEDDSYLVQAYKTKLAAAGFNLTIVTDGREALAALKVNTPKLIILDLIMPNMDGFAFLTEIKKQSAWKNIPVLVVTSLGGQEDKDKVIAAGAIDFIIKSDISLDALITRIKTIVAQSASVAQTPSNPR